MYCTQEYEIMFWETLVVETVFTRQHYFFSTLIFQTPNKMVLNICFREFKVNRAIGIRLLYFAYIM